MKKKLQFSLVIVLLSGAVWPQPFWVNSAGTESAPQAFRQPYVLRTQIKVARPNPATLPQILVAAQTPQSTCSGRIATSQDILQQAGGVNLNQPASCFDLSLGKTAALPEIHVKELAVETSVITVVSVLPVVEAAHVRQGPAGDSGVPVLPVAISLFLLVEIYGQDKKHELKARWLTASQLVENINFGRLRVLRC